MDIEKIGIAIELTRAQLGTVPKDPAVYKRFIASKTEDKARAEGEVLTVPDPEDVELGGWTGFHEDEDGLFIYEYMIKGFLKSAIETLIKNGSITKISAYKKWVDRMVFIEPRRLYFGIDKPDGIEERPLRVSTAQGPRVALTRSDFVKAGRRLSFEISLFKGPITKKAIMAALEYGQYVGLGQWRGSGGFGQFKVVE